MSRVAEGEKVDEKEIERIRESSDEGTDNWAAKESTQVQCPQFIPFF